MKYTFNAKDIVVSLNQVVEIKNKNKFENMPDEIFIIMIRSRLNLSSS